MSVRYTQGKGADLNHKKWLSDEIYKVLSSMTYSCPMNTFVRGLHTHPSGYVCDGRCLLWRDYIFHPTTTFFQIHIINISDLPVTVTKMHGSKTFMSS